jgi:hypothetical protein
MMFIQLASCPNTTDNPPSVILLHVYIAGDWLTSGDRHRSPHFAAPVCHKLCGAFSHADI